MANQITPLSYANTFGDWVVTTNKVLAETNDLQANNYTKDAGTLLINSSGFILYYLFVSTHYKVEQMHL